MQKHIKWEKNKLVLLDQRELPNRIIYVRCKNYHMAAKAIKDMIVRGAPAIGVSAAYGIAQAVLEVNKNLSINALTKKFENICDEFASTRPTAVNLFWAIERMKDCFYKNIDKKNISQILVKEANAVYSEDIKINNMIGKNSLKLFKKKINILTHCNAGALATAGYGTALGVIRSAYKMKKINMVYVDETRPYLQGMRLTAWELMQDKIPCVLNCDNMAGYLMSKGLIGAVVIGADRIAANGDTANKIGSYSLAILCKYHKIPFYVAAPCSTIDIKTKTGKGIIIEERDKKEITYINKKMLAPKNMKVANPSFDVVPVALISAIITEKGVIEKEFVKKLKCHAG